MPDSCRFDSLSEVNAIERSEVLTLHRDYLRLRRPLERRMYELRRKYCSRQSEWKISLELLRKKCGSTSKLKEFHRMVCEIVEQNALHSHIAAKKSIFDTDRREFRGIPCQNLN